jgi:hypothetical protein
MKLARALPGVAIPLLRTTVTRSKVIVYDNVWPINANIVGNTYDQALTFYPDSTPAYPRASEAFFDAKDAEDFIGFWRTFRPSPVNLYDPVGDTLSTSCMAILLKFLDWCWYDSRNGAGQVNAVLEQPIFQPASGTNPTTQNTWGAATRPNASEGQTLGYCEKLFGSNQTSPRGHTFRAHPAMVSGYGGVIKLGNEMAGIASKVVNSHIRIARKTLDKYSMQAVILPGWSIEGSQPAAPYVDWLVASAASIGITLGAGTVSAGSPPDDGSGKCALDYLTRNGVAGTAIVDQHQYRALRKRSDIETGLNALSDMPMNVRYGNALRNLLHIWLFAPENVSTTPAGAMANSANGGAGKWPALWCFEGAESGLEVPELGSPAASNNGTGSATTGGGAISGISVGQSNSTDGWSETWTVKYVSASDWWTVTGSVSGLLGNTGVSVGSPKVWTFANAKINFTITAAGTAFANNDQYVITDGFSYGLYDRATRDALYARYTLMAMLCTHDGNGDIGAFGDWLRTGIRMLSTMTGISLAAGPNGHRARYAQRLCADEWRASTSTRTSWSRLAPRRSQRWASRPTAIATSSARTRYRPTPAASPTTCSTCTTRTPARRSCSPTPRSRATWPR